MFTVYSDGFMLLYTNNRLLGVDGSVTNPLALNYQCDILCVITCQLIMFDLKTISVHFKLIYRIKRVFSGFWILNVFIKIYKMWPHFEVYAIFHG